MSRSHVRIEDVARVALVSTATVSRTLSQPDKVSEHTRRTVNAAIKQLGYVPDAAGRALASGRTKTIGCVLPTLDYAIFARSTHAMQTTLAAAGYQLLVASHEYSPAAEKDVVLALQQRGVDALVLVGTEHHPSLWSNLKNWGKPTFLTWSCDPRFPSVGFDNVAIGQLAAQHLIDLGHRHIGLISGHPEHNDRARTRIAGVRKALSSAGIKLPDALISLQPLTLAGGRQGLVELQAQKKPPTAIICGNDLLAVGALFQAERLGISVPHSLSICGIDNHEISAETNPPLTTINLPTQALGKITATQILAALKGESTALQSMLQFELLVRGTTAEPYPAHSAQPPHLAQRPIRLIAKK